MKKILFLSTALVLGLGSTMVNAQTVQKKTTTAKHVEVKKDGAAAKTKVTKTETTAKPEATTTGAAKQTVKTTKVVKHKKA
ncbi:hypothetical protein [Mucilaginibacter sp. CSA2-8R]|uniref:hypothetical protein n=1 Tax=Mucilaginibacter sp. CSA2-8R TaxID=3141542 RepID=UPI00315DF6F9